MSEQTERSDPAEIVKEAAIDAAEPAAPNPTKKRTAAIDRPYPRRTLEEALRIPTVLRTHNGGNAWPPSDVAKALGIGSGDNFFYITAAARDFGFTEGTLLGGAGGDQPAAVGAAVEAATPRASR